MSESLNCFVVVGLSLCALVLLARACDNDQNNCVIHHHLHQQNALIGGSKIRNQQVHDEPETVSKPAKDLKRILYWTDYNNQKDMAFGFGQEPFIRAGCEVTNCWVTDDRTELNRSDAVVFHAVDFEASDLPDHRWPHQRYIFLNLETLVNQRNVLPIFSSETDHYFNWTMTYREGSDIYTAAPVDGAILRRTVESLKNQLSSSYYQNKERDYIAPQLKLKIAKRFAKKGRGTIAWFCSDVITPGRREDYVQELKKHVHMDVYDNMSCNSSSHCDTLLGSYKFYFSAESSLCPDYVTEEFYRALEADVVPIVYGGADYDRYAPPHSYIHVADFGSPKELADYLHFLAGNEAMYSKYFNWKKDWELIKRPLNGWCDLCAKLNDPSNYIETKTYESISKWWYDDEPCLPGSSFLDSVLNKKNVI